MRTSITAGAFAAILAITGAACGDDGGSVSSDDTTDESTDEPSDGTSAEEWTAIVCGSMIDWIDAVAALDSDAEDIFTLSGNVDRTGDTGLETGDSGNNGTSDLSLEEQRELAVEIFDDAAAASEEFVEQVEDAGVPDINDGEALSELFVEQFAEVSDAFADARDAAEDLPVNNKADFNEAGLEILDDVDIVATNIQTAFDEAQSELDVEEFEDAFSDNDDCRELTATGA